MTRQRIDPFYIILIYLGLFSLVLAACQPVFSSPAETVRIGMPALEQNALIYIADEQGYFRQNGIDVVIKDYDSGPPALNALLQGQEDLAVAAEFPVVRNLLDKKPVMVVASIDKFENDYIVARQDRGITKVSDLKGKKIGVALQSINEFYLARFLELNQIRLEDVTLVDLKPAEFVPAMASGRVEAIIAWQPYIQQIEREVKSAVTWPAQNNQSVYGLLVASKTWLADHPQTAARFLKALLQAEDFRIHQPEKAKAIVQKRLNYEAAYVTKIWPDHEFTLTLDNSLIVAMMDEARWLIRSHLSNVTQTPEFYGSIYLEGLQAVKPEAVDIHR